MAAAPGLSGWLRSRWERFDGPSRIAGIDLARGLAVVGMLAAHLLVIDAFDLAQPTTWVDVVNGRSSILFATLAGVSIGLTTGGRVPLRGDARIRASTRIGVRAAALWVLGVVLMLTGVPVYVILPAYAILFLLTLPFLGLSARTLFVIAGALALVMPVVQVGLDALPLWSSPLGDQLALVIGWAYPFPTWIAFVLAGLAIGRCNLRSAFVAGVLLFAGIGLAGVGYGLDAASAGLSRSSPFLSELLTAAAHSTGLFEVIGAGGFALAAIGACLLLCRTPLRWLAIPLRAVGAVPLSAYTLQLVVWAVVATLVLGDPGDLVGFRDLDPFWPMTLGIIAASVVWVLFVGRGPLEAGIDRLARLVAPAPARRPAVDRLDG